MELINPWKMLLKAMGVALQRLGQDLADEHTSVEELQAAAENLRAIATAIDEGVKTLQEGK